MRRLAAPQGRIVFVILRTACSPPVAPHPASQRRSYLRLPESSIIPEEDFHLLNRACSQAHSFRRRPESSVIMVVRYPSPITVSRRWTLDIGLFLASPPPFNSLPRSGREDCLIFLAFLFGKFYGLNDPTDPMNQTLITHTSLVCLSFLLHTRHM